MASRMKKKRWVINYDLKITRTYKALGKKILDFTWGDLIEVVLDFEVQDLVSVGRCEVVDILPAGLSYVQGPWAMMRKLFPHLILVRVMSRKKLFIMLGLIPQVSLGRREPTEPMRTVLGGVSLIISSQRN